MGRRCKLAQKSIAAYNFNASIPFIILVMGNCVHTSMSVRHAYGPHYLRLMKRLYLLLFALCSLSLAAQMPSGDWTNYLSYRHADRCEVAGDLVFGVFGGNLLSYDATTQEVRLYSKSDGLGGREIVSLAYSTGLKALVLVYSDGMVDMLYPETDDVDHLVSLKSASSEVGTPLSLTVSGDYAILGTSKGVAVLNLPRFEVRGFYGMDAEVSSAVLSGGKVYAATGSKLVVGSMNDNLYDPASWQTAMAAEVLSMQPAESGGLYVQTQSSGLSFINGDGTTETLSGNKYTGTHQNGTRTVFFRDGEALVFDASSPKTVASTLTYEGTPLDMSPVSGSLFYLCRGDEGMQGWRAGQDGNLTAEGYAVTGYGAQTDRTGFLHFLDNGRLLTSGGTFNYYESVFYAPNAGYLEGGEWTFMQSDGVSEAIGTPYRSLTSMAQDPKDDTHHFVGTGDYGLFEFKDGKFVKQYNIHNSPLKAFYADLPSYVRVDGLCYDAAGNLWMSNEQVDTVLRVMKADGTWRSVFVNDIKSCRHIEHIMFDTDGRLWATQRDWIGNLRGGVLCVELADLDKPNGHSSTFRYSATNEDGTAVDFSQGVYCIVQDLTGRIWFGAYSGLYVIDDPAEFKSSNFLVTQVKVPRNDGTNYADYLLADIACSALAVDGADRKWIGTMGSGLYVVSSDGTEIIGQFKTDNSPLPSDNILSLAVNPETGEVFIGTDKGMVSYQSHVTQAAPALNRDNINVFPNPVRPDQGQVVTINGLTAGADLKIMTPSGWAVASGTSTGGTFRWNCCDTSGKMVPAGVYYILVATEDASDHVAAKVTVVR